MSLRWKVLLATGAILPSLLIVTYIVQKTVLADSFARLEEQHARANTTRVVNALAVELAQLESAASDWARWDDTYTFIEDANAEYVRSNLTESAFGNLRLNVMVFIHSSGRIVSAQAYDLQNQRAAPVPASLLRHLARESILLTHSDPLSVTTGILALPEDPLLVAALPILTSQNEGPSRGALVFGRFLTDDEIARLAETVQLPLAARQWNDAALPADFQFARAELSTRAPTIVQPTSAQAIAGYARLSDVYDQPALILRVETPRDIYQQGRLSQTYLTALTAIFGVATCVFLWFGLDRLILARLAHSARQMRRIGEQGVATQRVVVTGDDELGMLEREINRMLDAIPASEERFRALIEHSSDLILILNRDTTIRYASPSVQTILGYPADRVCGHSVLQFIDPDDHAVAQEAFAHRLTRPGASDEMMQVRARHRDGSLRTIELIGSNLLDNPAVAGIVVNCHDLTERERADAARRESEERWWTYIDQANDLIFALDASGRYTLANRALCSTLGYAAEEFIGKSPLEFIAPDARDFAVSALARVFGGEEIDRFEVDAVTRDQRRITLEIRGRTFRKGGAIVGTLHIARDVSERKLADEWLRQQKQQYQSLIENVSDIIALTDSHRLIRYASPSLERVLGYRPTDVIGMDAFALVHPDDLAATEEAFRRALQNPWLAHRIEHRLRHQDGTWRSVETIAQAHQREFGMDVAISTRDITERQRAAELLTAERNFLRTIIDAIPDVIFVKDTAGKFVVNNAYHLRTLGATTQADVFGKTVSDFHPLDLADQYLADDRHILATEQPLIEKEQPYLNCISGERRWHLMTKVPLRDASGKMIGIVGAGRDITERKKIEAELQRSQKEWRDIFNAIGHPTFILDLHHGVIAANPAVLKQLGKTEGEVLGRRCFHLFHDNDCSPVCCPAETLIHSGKAEAVEMEMQTVNGTFLVSCTPVLDDQGKLEKIIHIATDITELKRVQLALQESNARFYALVEGIPDVVYLKDAQGRNLYVNKAYEDFAGTSRANIVGKNDDEIMPPELAARCRESDLRTLEQGGTLRSEECTTDRHGNLICYETIKSPILDAAGNVTGLVGVSRDVTERKRAEQILAESERRFRALIESAPVAISLGRDGKLIYANPAYVQMHGFAAADELIGSEIAARVAPQSRDESFERSRLRAQGMSVETQYDLIGLRKDGTEFPMIATVTRVHLADGPANIGFFQDITERKRNEAALQEYSERLQQMVEARTRELRDAQDQLVRQERLATLGQLAGSIAHELRSPLGAIKNAAYYFKMCVENPSADAREMMQILDQQVDISARIIGSLLDFARPKAPTLQRAHLPHVIDAAVRQCEMPDDIALQWQVAENLPAVMVDAGQMQLVFRNFVANALQAMPEGGTLTIGGQRSAVSGQPSAIEIRITDTGVGIPPEAVDKIFQPLYTTKAKGIGLGLALCKMIIEAHGGTIGVTSQVGKGTAFTVTLPVE
ncbi:MAG: PAS domain S-box protein [Chloroflexi bacterium]|nr:PAS domain S-box protein [Chloroflexota bacterium]